MNFNVIGIESKNLGSNAFPTYFVTLKTVADAGTTSVDIFKSESKEEARKWARDYADTFGLRIEDATLVAEMVAAYRANGAINAAKYKAMSDAAVLASLVRAG